MKLTNKTMEITRVILFSLLLFSFLSCQTNDPLLKERADMEFPLLAKVFNGENRSCPGATVRLTDEKNNIISGQTDITGKILFPRVSMGTYYIEIEKENFEGVSFTFHLSGSDQALYGRLFSFDHLIMECRSKLDRGEWYEAASYLARADAIGSNPSLRIFLRSVILWKTDNVQESVDLLSDRIEEDPLIPDEALLFLADLYQYDLDDKASAIKILQLFLSRRNDSHIEERVRALGDEINE